MQTRRLSEPQTESDERIMRGLPEQLRIYDSLRLGMQTNPVLHLVRFRAAELGLLIKHYDY